MELNIGSLTSSTGTFSGTGYTYKWTSKNTTPALTITSLYNDISTSGDSKIYATQSANGDEKYTLSVPSGKVITGYSFTATYVSGVDITITPEMGGAAKIVGNGKSPVTVTVSNISCTSTYFTFSVPANTSTSTPTVISNLSVTVEDASSPISDGYYLISFYHSTNSYIRYLTSSGGQGYSSAAAVYYVSFNSETGCYLLQNVSDGTYLYANATQLSTAMSPNNNNAYTSGNENAISLGSTTSDFKYKWSISTTGDKYFIRPAGCTKTAMAVFSNANSYLSLHNTDAGYSYAKTSFIKPSIAQLLKVQVPFSKIIECGYTINAIRNQLKSDYSPATTGNIGWPTAAALTTFQSTVDAFTSSNTYDDLDDALDALWASVIFPSSGYYYIKGKPYSNYMLYDETLTKYGYDALLNDATTAKQLWKVTADGATLAVISSIGKSIACNSTSYPTITLEPAYDNGYPEFNGYFYFNGFHSPNSSTQAGTYAYNTSEAYSNSNPMKVVSYAHKESEGDYWTFVDACGDYDIYNVVIDDPISLSPTLTCTLDGYAGNATVYNGGFYAFAKNTEISEANFTAQTGITGYDDTKTTISISENTITVTYVPAKTYKELSSEYIADNAIPTKLGYAGTLGYPTSSSAGYTNLNTLVTTITAASEVTEAQYLNLVNYYTAYLAETDVIKPSTNTFWRIKGYATEKYVKSTTSNGQILNSVNAETDGSDIWYYSESNNLISYKNGLGTYNTRQMCPVGSTKNTITINHSSCTADGAQNFGVFEIVTDYSSPYWYSNTNNVDRNTNNNHVNCEWLFEPVTSLPVTLTSIDGHGFASFYTPVAISTLPSGVKAYIATIDKSASRIRFTSIDNIPANTGVILYQPTYAEGPVNLTIGDANADVSGNKLSGNVATVARNSQNVMTMQIVNENLGFYKYTGTNLSGFKAYIDINDIPSEVKSFVFDFDDDDATGIASLLEKAGEETAIYNLAGQRMNKMQKGINIINGKKVLK